MLERLKDMKNQIEILAPAGSYDSMRAAMNAGCDAVYIGGHSFGARAYAENPEDDILLRAIDEAHLRDKKLYLTVNTLIKDKEMTEKLYDFLTKFYLGGLDAVIVQDVGVMHFIHRHFPKLPIHASTQTTITMAQGAELIEKTGVTRLVTARELSLSEIRKLRDNTDLEIETFVHGALCYCYSGQCLMSSIIGGRSGNRGRCAQPCRMPYKFYSGDRKISAPKEKYLLSPKDINTVAMIPELVEAGIDSFKIEGRMKRPEYSAGVSAIYRKYLDLYYEMGREKYNRIIDSSTFTQDMKDLQDLYNRGGFSEGYGKTYHGKTMMSLYRPNHSGVYAGIVTQVNVSQVSITLKEDVYAQDILEIRTEEDETGYEFTVKDAKVKGRVLVVNTGKPQNKIILAGLEVYRTRNNRLLEKITADYMKSDRKTGIRGNLKAIPGEILTLTLTYQDITVTATGDTVQEAVNQPMTAKKLSAPISKLGDTLFYMEELSVDEHGDAFIPVTRLNEIRRDAVLLLTEAVLNSFRRKDLRLADISVSGNSDPSTGKTERSYRSGHSVVEGRPSPGICVSLSTGEQFRTVLPYKEITSVYADYDGFTPDEILKMAVEAGVSGKNFYVLLPHILRSAVYDKLEKDIVLLWGNKDISGFVAKNFEETALLKKCSEGKSTEKEIILNANMYVFNREAKEFWKEYGIDHFTAPLELNSQDLKTLRVNDCDLMVYGYLPLMVSTQCLYESTTGCKRCKAGETRKDYLVDRLGKKFFVRTNCNGCYNVIYNGQYLSLLKHRDEVISLEPENLRMDFTFETGTETDRVLAAFITAYLYGGEDQGTLNCFTAGHFKRGVE